MYTNKKSLQNNGELTQFSWDSPKLKLLWISTELHGAIVTSYHLHEAIRVSYSKVVLFFPFEMIYDPIIYPNLGLKRGYLCTRGLIKETSL